MENLDVEVLRHLRDWRAAARRAIVVTVMRTWGSSPRPVGSIMAMCEDGSVCGSVSGGCIEDDLLDRFVHRPQQGVFDDAPPEVVTYGLTADEAHRFGLPCGGTLELLIERNPDRGKLAGLLEALEQGGLVERVVDVKDGAVSQAPAHPGTMPRTVVTGFANVFGPSYRMLLIGAGSLAAYLATMARFNGFDVTVCDPRDEYRRVWDGPLVHWTTEMPDDAVRTLHPDRRTCIIALTHDPKLDDLALLEALHSSSFYIGAIGSRRNSSSRRQRMMDHFGETEESLSNLRGPIGLPIGSRTPPEIAVSIMAQVLAAKNSAPIATLEAHHAKQPPIDAGCEV